jgi:FkbM family methyltransferase
MADQKRLLGGKVDVILDVGAYTGQMALKYRKIFPDAIICCFEPHPEIFKVLSEIESKRTFVYNLAVSDKEDMVNFQVNRDCATNSLLTPSKEISKWADNADAVIPTDTIRVKTVTIDNFCKERSIGHIDILKMDIQGGEMMALRGAKRMLSSRQVDLIYTELLFVPLYQGQASFEAICEYLSVWGYNLFNLYNFALDRLGRLKWCDGVFCSVKVLEGV